MCKVQHRTGIEVGLASDPLLPSFSHGVIQALLPRIFGTDNVQGPVLGTLYPFHLSTEVLGHFSRIVIG